MMQNEWMGDLLRPFQQYSVISGQCLGDTERLCAMEPRLWLERFLPERGSNLGLLDQ